jgi:hypothetical protein
MADIAIPTVASYTVPAKTPSYRNLGAGTASAINRAILSFDQLMAQAARDDDFMSGPPTTFKVLLDNARVSDEPYLVIQEKVGLFAFYLLGENHTRKVSGEDQALAAETVSLKIRNVGYELVWSLKNVEPTGVSFEEWSKWLSEVVKNFKDRYNKNNESPTADSLSTLSSLPLFGVIERNNPSQMLETDPDGAFSITTPPLDLRTVIDGLMVSRNSEDYAKILMLILTRSAVGRAGENQFLSYKYMAMEPYFNVLMARWFMPKQLKIALVVFTMDFKHFQLCPFCGFAFFWIMGGLYRHHNIVDKEEASYVFPTLRKDNSDCARIETAIIQRFVPDSRYKSKFTSRSLRISGSNVLNASQFVTEAEAVAAGGWCDGKTNISHYLRYVLALLLAPARCLANWMLPREEHFLPDLSCLSGSETEDVKRLIGLLYPTVRVAETKTMGFHGYRDDRPPVPIHGHSRLLCSPPTIEPDRPCHRGKSEDGMETRRCRVGGQSSRSF